MRILTLHPELVGYLAERHLKKKFEKQKSFFERDPFHPSLGTELLEPKTMGIWSFRLDQKYRALFIFRGKDSIEIIDINNHYR